MLLIKRNLNGANIGGEHFILYFVCLKRSINELLHPPGLFDTQMNVDDYMFINLRESCIRRKPITSRSHSEITQDGNPVLRGCA